MRANAAGRVEIVRMKSDTKSVVAENAAAHLTFEPLQVHVKVIRCVLV